MLRQVRSSPMGHFSLFRMTRLPKNVMHPKKHFLHRRSLEAAVFWNCSGSVSDSRLLQNSALIPLISLQFFSPFRSLKCFTLTMSGLGDYWTQNADIRQNNNTKYFTLWTKLRSNRRNMTPLGKGDKAGQTTWTKTYMNPPRTMGNTDV